MTVSRAPPVAGLDHRHRHRAVGEEDHVAGLEVAGQLAIGAGQLVGVVRRPVGDQGELVAEPAIDRVAGDRPQANLGPAQVLQDREHPAVSALGDRADRRERGGVLVVGPVREVEPEDVDARLDQSRGSRPARATPGRRRHDLGPDLAQRFVKWSRHDGMDPLPVVREIAAVRWSYSGRREAKAPVVYRPQAAPEGIVSTD